jgi:excisionase family DNA binding protein
MESFSTANRHEPFVDADRAAAFLAISRKTILKLARRGDLPGHPVGRGVRQMWRFRLSELALWMGGPEVKLGSDQGRNQERKSFS